MAMRNRSVIGSITRRHLLVPAHLFQSPFPREFVRKSAAMNFWTGRAPSHLVRSMTGTKGPGSCSILTSLTSLDIDDKRQAVLGGPDGV